MPGTVQQTTTELPRILPAAAAGLLALVLVTTVVPSGEAEARAARHFGREAVERLHRHGEQRRLLFWARTGVDLCFFAALLATPLGGRLARGAARLARGRWLPTLLVHGASLFLLHAAVALPLRMISGWAHRRAWGLTEREFLPWLAEHLLAAGVSGAIAAPALAVLYLLMRRFPRRWWIPAGLGATAFAAFLSLAYP
ncbi:MAG: hypothetical protein ACREID_04010, partial [Planctomycetota bacterium]